jgi:hypothetical protein
VKDPQPLLDDGATALELELLRAGDADRPSPKSRQAALAALGLSTAVLGASSPVAAAAGRVALSPGARLLAAKWWAISALVAASGGAGLGYATWHGAPAPKASVNSVSKPSLPPLSPTFVAEAPAPEVSAAPIREVPSLPERPPSPPSRSSSSASDPGIQDQIALIDRARGAVAAHQPAAAMAALDEYQRRFPAGVLAQEATLLRIETLAARGDKADAARLGRQFLERYPRSAMAARVKALTGG